MASNSDGSGEYRGIYCNVDGLTQPKLNEISDISRRDPNLLFIYVAEAKHQQGMSSLDFDIPGFNCTEALRESSQTGGLILWTREQSGKAILPWSGLDKTPSWINSERVWVLINDKTSRLACCGVYLRVESPKSSDFYISNQQLLEHIEMEKADLESKGYAITLLGDFNARIEPGSNFAFNDYPHDPNNNGRLLVDFATRNQLYCLNPMKWKGVQEEAYTYHRVMGTQLHRSIIDYGLATQSSIMRTSSFSVEDGMEYGIESDHSTLVWTMKLFKEVYNQDNKPSNPLRYIKKWAAFTKVLDQRLASSEYEFKSLSCSEQGEYIKQQFQLAGTSVIPGSQRKNRKQPAITTKMRKLLKESKVIKKRLKNRQFQPPSDISKLRSESNRVNELIRVQSFTESLNIKRRIRSLLAQKGVRAQRLFWNLVNRKPKKKNSFEALETPNGISTDKDAMNTAIENFFEVKFNTSFDPEDVIRETIDESTIGIPTAKFTQETSDHMMRRLSMDELNSNINDLNVTKAEGLDGVTNNMIRHAGPVAREHLLTMFNNVIVGGQTPTSWKEGDVVLILKRPPQTDINNYRPITLISCLSKLLTKILAKRFSEALQKDDVIGPEQNGFRSSRTCGDNIFILNSILEMNKNKKLLSHLLFVDLKEAYDRVDRDILLCKLKQLNVSDKFINFLSSYYFLDNISTASSGKRTRKQYQKRGLRQGCNLSSILFIIYMIELSARMRASGVGIRLESGELVNILLFADDIIIISNSTESLAVLKEILEQWCKDYRMKISISKTNIITSLEDLICKITDTDTLEEEIVAHVSNYKYLGIKQFSSTWRTAQRKGQDMISRAIKYKNVILRTHYSLVDSISSSSAIWQNIAIPGILYGTDAIPVSPAVIQEIEVIQNQLGKALLRVPQSTANVVVQVELGWKPFKLLVEKCKLHFFQRVNSQDFKGSSLLTACMQWCMLHPNNAYISNTMDILGHLGNSPQELMNITTKQLHQKYESAALTQIQEMVTLKLLPIPKKWWVLQSHVENTRWSTMIVKFRIMNTGLGNRDAYRAADSVCQDGGRILQCPLCYQGSNNEIHLLLKCEMMSKHRQAIKLRNGQTIQDYIFSLQKPNSDELSAVRRFLTQEKGVSKLDMVDRGIALEMLVDKFFLEWSTITGRMMSRQSPSL